MLSLVAALCLNSPDQLDFARAELRRSLGTKAEAVRLAVSEKGPKESYSIAPVPGGVQITGSDKTGAMYGAFEFAERVRNQGAAAWKAKAAGSPFLAERGVNLFLTLPWDYKKNDTDYEPAALVDPERWWFQNEDYWTTLLDLMAQSRLNWLDIHGAWDISVTNAPNLYAYFVTSPSFPQVGVSEEIKRANLRQLNHVVEMAHARGIRVSLMAYEANLRIPQNPSPPYEASEPNVYKYTREAVTAMIRQCPGLDAIGFRIGESGRSESFFNCYLEAVRASGRDIPLITRSWITTKQKVLPLARASKDFTVEIKYNGEQWGAPYPVMGGRMANWGSYSFEDYLSDSTPSPRLRGEGAGGGGRLWPGNPYQVVHGSKVETRHWPSEPYKIVWQVRANGTHRIFPFYNPDWVRRSILAMKMGTATGYTVEGEDAYYPKSPDYYLADPADKYCNWIHQRDEMYWMSWGRLGYEPHLGDGVFVSYLKRWFGDQAVNVATTWERASKIVPESYLRYALGPDHRDHAPELETGGGIQAHLEGEPFDTLVFSSVRETQLLRSLDISDGRRPNDLQGAFWFGPGVEFDADVPFLERATTATLPKPNLMQDPGRLRWKELSVASKMLGHVADYHASLNSAAAFLADSELRLGAPTLDEFSTKHLREAESAWLALSETPEADFYRPFTERLRMHTNTFHWRQQLPGVRADVENTLKLPSHTRGSQFLDAVVSRQPKLSLRVQDKAVTVAVKDADRAWLLEKPLPSSTFFHKVPMSGNANKWSITVERRPWGHCLAVEVLANGSKRRMAVNKLAPYYVIPSLARPTPQIYSTAEAMTYLDPAVLSPEKHGMILIAPRANTFFNHFDRATKRKLLEPVSRGMTLMILQQDYVSGRYKLDWLPKPIGVENAPERGLFDPGAPSPQPLSPGGARGFWLPKVETTDILWQRFVPSGGWEVFGNGGVARMAYGKGQIWLVNGRFMQRATNPGAARAIKALLTHNSKLQTSNSKWEKPVVLIDAGTEGSTSFWPDVMNALNMPFLTVGEVIAEEQGMNSFTPIAGPVADDDVLGGKGKDMANAWLRKRVTEMAKRPQPASLAEFEKERARRKRELYRTLGLDPMPPKTPLNARVTGTIQREGFRIEKVVFESRPNFYVTAHVYVPDRPSDKPQRFPIVVNVNGHWAHKKDEDRIQLRCQFQALQGYIAIAIDSPGHSFEGDSLIERRPEGDHNDFFLVQGGLNTTGIYVWDAMRALDYMATRPDTDMSRIGLTGASGGGLATLYTFAADDRYICCVPVVYMSSMELAPDNGCLCNHVPGTMQIGDRSDIMAIQAPKPVYIMGAQNDGEFPPDAMRLTHTKMQPTWALFGKATDTYVRIFDGPHDYNQLMREASLGFFNKYLKAQGDGSPVPQPALKAIDPEDRQLLVLDPPITGERTMRDLAREHLGAGPKQVSAKEAIAVNGGVPASSAPLQLKEQRRAGRVIFNTNNPNVIFSEEVLTFEPAPGLLTAGVAYTYSASNRLRLIASDTGKAQKTDHPEKGVTTVYLDIIGTGELTGTELRYPVYMGTSVPFLGGWQLVRAAEALAKYGQGVELVGRGPISSQAVMWAGLLSPNFKKITGYDCLGSWEDVFKPGVSPYAIQPRANLCGSLEHLRSLVRNGEWHIAK